MILRFRPSATVPVAVSLDSKSEAPFSGNFLGAAYDLRSSSDAPVRCRSATGLGSTPLPPLAVV